MGYEHPVEVVTEHVGIDDETTDLIIANYSQNRQAASWIVIFVARQAIE